MTKEKKKQDSQKMTAGSSKKAVLEKIRLNAAGVDIGSEEIYIATLEGPVEKFNTFTRGINESLRYMQSKGVDSVVMETTGIYWWPIYDLYSAAGLDVYIVNACHAKNVPGRKTDVLDSEWLRELHTYGLLRSSFVPEADICKLRVFMRSRQDHIEMAATHVNIMQKHLDAMNIKLHNVISSLTGVSGIQIIQAMLSGERDTKKLAALCSERIDSKKLPEVELSLEGHYKEEHLFGLQQALDTWSFYQDKIRECDRKIEALLKSMIKDKAIPQEIKTAKGISNPNKLKIKGLHEMLITYTGGRDASQLPGFNDYSLTRVISETGIDMSPWPTEKHFT